MCAPKHAHMFAYLRTCMQARSLARMHLWRYVRIYMHACTHACTHARTHARTHACMHTRTHTHARSHARTHARTHSNNYSGNNNRHTSGCRVETLVGKRQQLTCFDLYTAKILVHGEMGQGNSQPPTPHTYINHTPRKAIAGETGHPRNWSTKKGNGQLPPSIDPPEGLAERGRDSVLICS